MTLMTPAHFLSSGEVWEAVGAARAAEASVRVASPPPSPSSLAALAALARALAMPRTPTPPPPPPSPPPAATASPRGAIAAGATPDLLAPEAESVASASSVLSALVSDGGVVVCVEEPSAAAVLGVAPQQRARQVGAGAGTDADHGVGTASAAASPSDAGTRGGTAGFAWSGSTLSARGDAFEVVAAGSSPASRVRPSTAAAGIAVGLVGGGAGPIGGSPSYTAPAKAATGGGPRWSTSPLGSPAGTGTMPLGGTQIGSAFHRVG